LDEKPVKANPTILKPGTTRVTRNKAMAEDTHLKRPKVIRFKGISRTLIIGLIKRVATVNPTPARRRLGIPFSKIMPETKVEII
jgi:hypothetical protein